MEKFYTTSNTIIALGVDRCPLDPGYTHLNTCLTYNDDIAALMVNQGHHRFITDEEVAAITALRIKAGMDKV